MRFCLAAFVAALTALFAAAPVLAATTVYPAATFSNSGVVSPSGLLGNTPSVTQFNRTNSIGLRFNQDITKFTLSFEIATVTAQTTYIWVRFGRLVGSTFTNAPVSGLLAPNGAATSNLYALINGPGTYYFNSVVYAAGCATIGGCNAVVFGNSTFSATGSRFGVSTVGATPEPAAWALMIVAFAGVGWRLKTVRGSRPFVVKRTIFADLAANRSIAAATLRHRSPVQAS